MPQKESARLSPLVFGRSSRSLGSQVLPTSSLKVSSLKTFAARGSSPGSAAVQKPSPPPPSEHLQFLNINAAHCSSTPSFSRPKTVQSIEVDMAATKCAFPSKAVAAASWSTPCTRCQAPPRVTQEGTAAQYPAPSSHLSTPVTITLQHREPSERVTTTAQPRDSPSTQKRLPCHRSALPAGPPRTPNPAKPHVTRDEPLIKAMSSFRLTSSAKTPATLSSAALRQRIQVTPITRSSSSQQAPHFDHKDSPVAQGSGMTTRLSTCHHICRRRVDSDSGMILCSDGQKP